MKWKISRRDAVIGSVLAWSNNFVLVLHETMLVLVLVIESSRVESIMTRHFFDHDRLDVYRLSIEYVANAFDSSRSLEGLHRHARDQWLRAAQSIPLNVAEGSGRRSVIDRARFLDIARGLNFPKFGRQ